MKNRIIAITGGFGILGTAIGRVAASRGAKVALIDRADAPADLPEGVLALGGVDLTDLASARTAMATVRDHFSGLDALCNIAGGFRWETLEDGDLDSWDFLYAINIKTAAAACKAALPALKDSGSGRIVNVGAAGAIKAGMGMGAYAASKSGVMRLTEALADETKASNLNVNAVLPSIIDTPQNRADMPDADHSKWVTTSALADVVVFLASDASRAITGAAIPVYGQS